jgi:hypothetical protein
MKTIQSIVFAVLSVMPAWFILSFCTAFTTIGPKSFEPLQKTGMIIMCMGGACWLLYHYYITISRLPFLEFDTSQKEELKLLLSGPFLAMLLLGFYLGQLERVHGISASLSSAVMSRYIFIVLGISLLATILNLVKLMSLLKRVKKP